MNLRNTSVLGISKIFEKGVVFFIYSIIAHSYGPSDLGVFVVYFTLGQFLFTLLDLGGELYQIRLFSEKKNLFQFQNIVFLKIFIFLSIIAILISFNQTYELVLVSTIFFLESIISIFKSYLYVNKLFITESKISLFEKSILLTSTIVLVYLNSPIEYIYYTFIISKLFYLFVGYHYYLNKRILALFKKSMNFNFTKNYLSGSLSYIFHGLLTLVFFQIDILMLGYFKIDDNLIGQYSAAVKLFGLGLVVNEIFFKQYYPVFAKLVNQRSKLELITYSNKIHLMNIWSAVAICIPIILFSDTICDIAFGSSFNMTSTYLRSICFVIYLRFILSRDSAILSSTDFNKNKVLISLTCSIVNISINFFLIPLYGIKGAIISTLFTEFLLTILMMIMRHILIVKINFNYNILFGGVIIIITTFASLVFDINILTKSIITIFLISIIYFKRRSIFQSFQ
jgi:O-antigen/teichoic acid export membrane protein